MHILGSLIFLTICGIVSFALNIFLLVVFVKGFPVLCKLPYYYYCFQILICNIIGLLVKFVYLPLITFIPKETIPETYMVIIALAETISYHGELFFILALSVYRVLIFVFGRQMSTRIIIFHVTFVWINISGFIFFQCYYQCFDTTVTPNVIENGAWDEIEFYSACTFKSVPEYLLILATTIVNDYFPIISLILYGCIVFKIRYDFRHFVKTFKLKRMVENKTHRSDLYILLQLVLSSVLETCPKPMKITETTNGSVPFQAIAIYACFFFNFRVLIIIGYDYKKLELNWIYAIIYFSMYIRNTIQPIFLLFFNQSVRKISKTFLSKRKVQRNVAIFISVK